MFKLCIHSLGSSKGLSIRRPQSGGTGVCPARTFFVEGRVLQMRKSALFGVKNFGIYLIDKGVGPELMRTSFTDDP